MSNNIKVKYYPPSPEYPAGKYDIDFGEGDGTWCDARDGESALSLLKKMAWRQYVSELPEVDKNKDRYAIRYNNY